MSTPVVSANVRRQVYVRDGERCVSCGGSGWLTVQHREALGMGGRPAFIADPAELVTACGPCNESFEAHRQAEALLNGWKLRRNRGQIRASDVPYFDWSTGLFWRPDVHGGRVAMSERDARVAIFEANGVVG